MQSCTNEHIEQELENCDGTPSDVPMHLTSSLYVAVLAVALILMQVSAHLRVSLVVASTLHVDAHSLSLSLYIYIYIYIYIYMVPPAPPPPRYLGRGRRFDNKSS